MFIANKGSFLYMLEMGIFFLVLEASLYQSASVDYKLKWKQKEMEIGMKPNVVHYENNREYRIYILPAGMCDASPTCQRLVACSGLSQAWYLISKRQIIIQLIGQV